MHLTWLINQITGRQGVPCLFHLLTGFYCPGCGGTRAVRLLLMGDVAGSFRYHPFVPYMAVVLLAEVLLFTGSILAGFRIKKEQGKPVLARRDTKKTARYRTGLARRYRYWTAVGAGIVVINWLVKNVLLIAGIDLLPPL